VKGVALFPPRESGVRSSPEMFGQNPTFSFVLGKKMCSLTNYSSTRERYMYSIDPTSNNGG